MNNQTVYRLPNAAIHLARQQLEQPGILNPWARLEQLGDTAAEINVGVRSLSRLNLVQRRLLIERLIETAPGLKAPIIYQSDRAGRKCGAVHSSLGRAAPHHRALAARITARKERFYEPIRPPRNAREVTTLRIALESMPASHA